MKNSNVWLNEELLLLDSYYLELNFNKRKLALLEKHRPFFFQKRKKIIYQEEINSINKQIKKYENLIEKVCNRKLRK